MALVCPVTADFSPANGFSLRIAAGYLGHFLPLSHGWSGALVCNTWRALSASVLLPKWV